MKRFFTFVLTISLIISCMTFSVQAVSFADDYVFPAGLPTKYRSSIFTVSVDETPVGTYKAGLNVWGNEVACCAFSTATAVTITVTTDFAFSSARTSAKCKYIVLKKRKYVNLFHYITTESDRIIRRKLSRECASYLCTGSR